MNSKYFTIIFLLGLLAYSCSGGGSANEIKIDGSSTVYPLSEAVAEDYRNQGSDARITVGLSGTGGGFQKFIRGETDINNASREIKESEIKLAEESGVDYVSLMVAYDGMAVVVHPENDWIDYLTVEELKTIWEPDAQGTITRWNQIREEWPDREIQLFGPGVASGTYDYFTEVIVGESGSSRGDFTASEDDNVLVQGVSTDIGALGFFGLAYYEENQEKLRLVPIQNEEGEEVVPTVETVSEGTYSPLSRPMFIYVSRDASQRQVVQDFVTYYLDNASGLARDVGYVALPDSLYEVQKEKFRDFVSSSAAASESD